MITKHINRYPNLFLFILFFFIISMLCVSPEIKAQQNKSSASKKNSSAKKSQSKTKQAPLPWPQNLLALAKGGAVLLVDHHNPQGPEVLYSLNADKLLVPASILKVVTMGAALEFLGADYRFKTDFLLSRDLDLWIIGYGDPYLVSEELIIIVGELQKRGLKEINNIYIDESYFKKDIILDGNTQTMSSYDAYNLAFGVNFNTVSFRKNKKGQTLKASASIPLTDFAHKKASEQKKAGTYRLNINESPDMAAKHAGETFKAHLEEAGIKVNGEILTDQQAPETRKIYYRHFSSKTLKEALAALMEHSNNFMSNQIFLSLGAELYGAPATLEKSQLAMDVFFKRHGLKPLTMGDGSGLSRNTTITAAQMVEILRVVEPARELFTASKDGLSFNKTGTMSDIKTLGGYVVPADKPDNSLSFVILLNGLDYSFDCRDKILSLLVSQFLPNSSKNTTASKH